MNNGNLTPELAEKLLNCLCQTDEGNEAIMTDIFTRFSNTFPEHMNLVNKIYQREVGRPFRTYIERVSKRGY